MSPRTRPIEKNAGRRCVDSMPELSVPMPAVMGLRRSLIALVILSCLVAAAYHNSGHKEFEFDSAGTTITNSKTRDLRRNVHDLLRSPLGGSAGLTYITFSLNCAVNEALNVEPFNVTSFVVVNVAIHAVNAFLVFR